MASHNPFNRCVGNTGLIDELIGSAYPVVKHVSANMAYIKHVSHHLPDLYRLYESIDNVDLIIPEIPFIHELLENIVAINSLHTNIIELLEVHSNLEVINNLNDNTAALLAAENSINNNVILIQEYINDFGDVDSLINQIEAIKDATDALKVLAETAANDASDSKDLAQDWAEGTEPGGSGTKSAKEWVQEAIELISNLNNDWTVDGPFYGTGNLQDYLLTTDPGFARNMFVLTGGGIQLFTDNSYSLVRTGSQVFIRINAPVGIKFEVHSGKSTVTNLAIPSAGSVGPTQVQANLWYDLAPVGIAVDSWTTAYGSAAGITTIIPADGTPPQATEGTAVLAITAVTKSATNKLRIRVCGSGSCALQSTWAAALFVTSGGVLGPSAAQVAPMFTGYAGANDTFSMEYEFVPGIVGPVYCQVNAGPGGATTLVLNGSAGVGASGGASCWMTIEEIKG